MRKIILTRIPFCGFVFTSCESEQVKIGRRTVYDDKVWKRQWRTKGNMNSHEKLPSEIIMQ